MLFLEAFSKVHYNQGDKRPQEQNPEVRQNCLIGINFYFPKK